MAKASPIQNDFTAGEVSPLVRARTDIDRYKKALTLCKDYIPTIEGALTRRPGSAFVNEVKDSTKLTHLLRFSFSVTDSYAMEFGDLYIRFYRNYGILGGVTPIEVVSPYTEADIPGIRYYQTGDSILILHRRHHPRVLRRFAESDFTITSISQLDTTGPNAGSSGLIGPFAPMHSNNASSTKWNDITMQTSGTPDFFRSAVLTGGISSMANNGSGGVRVVFDRAIDDDGNEMPDRSTVILTNVSGVSGMNATWVLDRISPNTYDLVGASWPGGAFVSGDYQVALFLNRSYEYIRYRPDNGATTYIERFLINVAGTEATPLDGTITLGSAVHGDMVNRYQLHVWDQYNGYPTVAEFHESRLWLGGIAAFPQRLDASQPEDYFNFTPSAGDGTVSDGHAISATLLTQDLNQIYWLKSDDKGLIVGMAGKPQVVKPANSLNALSATNISVKKSSFFGAADVEALQIGQAIIYAMRGAKSLNEIQFAYQTENFSGISLSRLAKNMVGPGIAQACYMQEPHSIIWVRTTDNRLLGVSYDREADSLVAGWHRHIVGGVSDAADAAAEVESICVLPSADGNRDELWMIVKRRIDGTTKRYVEYLEQFFDEDMVKEDAWFLDSALELNNPLTISDITEGGGAVTVEVTGHGLSNGDSVRVNEVESETEEDTTSLNGRVFEIENVTTDTFDLKDVDPATTAAYIQGGVVRKMVSTVSGLSHLEGETVSVFVDGAEHPDVEVSGGSITLEEPGCRILVGFKVTARAQLLRFDAGSETGTAIGKLRRTEQVGLFLERTVGLRVGASFDDMYDVQDTLRENEDQNNEGPALYSGITVEGTGADSDYDNLLSLEQANPYPGTILAVMPGMVTQDGG